MQGAFFYLGLLASTAVGFAAADDLKIDVTRGVECDRKTVKGDRISVHYRGSLQANGKEFDASYNRGKPFQVKIGAGQVIQGFVHPSSGWSGGIMLPSLLRHMFHMLTETSQLGAGPARNVHRREEVSSFRGCRPPWWFRLADRQYYRTLTIPPELGYGQRGMGPIPAGSVLSTSTTAASPLTTVVTS